MNAVSYLHGNLATGVYMTPSKPITKQPNGDTLNMNSWLEIFCMLKFSAFPRLAQSGQKWQGKPAQIPVLSQPFPIRLTECHLAVRERFISLKVNVGSDVEQCCIVPYPVFGSSVLGVDERCIRRIGGRTGDDRRPALRAMSTSADASMTTWAFTATRPDLALDKQSR